MAALACTVLIDGKTMWGARKRKDEDNDNFVYRKGPPAANQVKPKVVEKATARRIARKSSDDIAASVGPILESMVEKMDELLQSDLLDQFINPDNMKKVFEAIPQLSNLPNVQEVLDSIDSTDPTQLKDMLVESLDTVRKYLSEMKGVFDDPEKVQEIIDQLPPELLVVLNTLKSGDFTALKGILNDFPGEYHLCDGLKVY